MPTQPSPEDRADDLIHRLRQFTGDLKRWGHPLCRALVYTPGIRCLAEEAGAYWLIDAIASWLPSKAFARARAIDPRVGEICFWTLTVAEDRSATLVARADSGEPPVIKQSIEYTDFPLASMDLWCAWDGKGWTLMLPSEY